MENGCLRYDGPSCVLCAYRYYINAGICIKVEDTCLDYDRTTGVCQDCYEGYYLNSSKNCKQLAPLCQRGDSNGNCLQCYKDCKLVGSLCVNINRDSVLPWEMICAIDYFKILKIKLSRITISLDLILSLI